MPFPSLSSRRDPAPVKTLFPRIAYPRKDAGGNPSLSSSPDHMSLERLEESLPSPPLFPRIAYPRKDAGGNPSLSSSPDHMSFRAQRSGVEESCCPSPRCPRGCGDPSLPPPSPQLVTRPAPILPQQLPNLLPVLNERIHVLLADEGMWIHISSATLDLRISQRESCTTGICAGYCCRPAPTEQIGPQKDPTSWSSWEGCSASARWCSPRLPSAMASGYRRRRSRHPSHGVGGALRIRCRYRR